MIIVNYDTFVKLPKCILYCEVEPCVFGEVRIKEETINDGNDWFFSDLTSNPTYDSDICGEAYDPMVKGIDIKPNFNVQTRDGMFDYDRMFLIYSKEDIQLMIDKLNDINKSE